MKKTTSRLLALIIVGTLILGACNLPEKVDQADLDATTVAETSAAVFTKAAETAAASAPSATPTSVDATVTPIATNTLFPTQIATATKTPIPCNRATFVKDVTIPDNTSMAAGATFTKTWRLQNSGSCSWDSGYVLLFDSGEQMGAPATATITNGSIAPGETLDISVNLTAPTTSGTYQGNFKLRSPNNVVFGINADGQGPFWVKIVVAPPTATPTSVVAKPDIIITDYTLVPNPPTKNQNVTINISVYNNGTAAAGAFKVQWWSSISAPSAACEWDIPSMVAKGGLVKSCTYQYPSWYAKITTKVIVDSGNAIAESDETNNSSEVEISVNDSP
jgi:hypothetical protein